ncbi:response regulator transcription factor [Streptomyces sp. NPDC012794]|uniref:response regulator transcription factor n=1 Tax=Streptomyces sp. NPDC012794 TaxID=3364850 RepID=UPI0036B65EE3
MGQPPRGGTRRADHLDPLPRRRPACQRRRRAHVRRPVVKMPRTEREVLGLMAQGRTLVQIATQWDVSTGTVHEYAERLRRRLGAETNPQAVLLACRAGLLDGRPFLRHGDHAGYETHRKRRIPYCDDCRAGEKAYRESRREALKAREAA